MFHTLFNITNVLLLIWFVHQIASIVEKIIKRTEEEEEEYKLEYFSTNVQPVPEIAIIEAKKEVIKMSEVINEMLELFIKTFKTKQHISKSISKARKIETLSDQMQEQISTYLAECTKHELSLRSSQGSAVMMRLINELESIGDSIFNLFIQMEGFDNDIKFNDEMNEEIINFYAFVFEFSEWNHSFIADNLKPMTNLDLDKSIKYENKIDDIRNKLLDSSQKRLSNGSNPKSELIFMDMIKHLEHIGDYSLNISQALEQID